MPMYQYACRSCGQEFEKKLPMSQSGETQACPACASMDTRKRIGAIAVTGGALASAGRPAPVTSPFS